jgi:hypothetical protein
MNNIEILNRFANTIMKTSEADYSNQNRIEKEIIKGNCDVCRWADHCNMDKFCIGLCPNDGIPLKKENSDGSNSYHEAIYVCPLCNERLVNPVEINKPVLGENEDE